MLAMIAGYLLMLAWIGLPILLLGALAYDRFFRKWLDRSCRPTVQPRSNPDRSPARSQS